MEKRTLVKSGTSSFTLALPIDWIRRNKLDKGSEVTITENEVGELVLSTNTNNFIPNKEFHTIKLNEETSDILYWILLRAYLRNYTSIIIEGKDLLTKAPPIISKLNNFIGLNIIEQNKDTIVLKNYSALDNETSPYSLIKKIDVGIRAMFDLLNSFFKTGFHKEDVYELELQHEYNERLFLLALKLINNIIENPRQMKTFKTNYRELMNEHSLATTLKQLSLILVQLGKTFLYLEPSKKQVDFLENIHNSLFKKYKVIMSVPRDPLSKESFFLLSKSETDLNKWKTELREIKNPYLWEFILYATNANNLLDQLIITAID